MNILRETAQSGKAGTTASRELWSYLVQSRLLEENDYPAVNPSDAANYTGKFVDLREVFHPDMSKCGLGEEQVVALGDMSWTAGTPAAWRAQGAITEALENTGADLERLGKSWLSLLFVPGVVAIHQASQSMAWLVLDSTPHYSILWRLWPNKPSTSWEQGYLCVHSWLGRRQAGIPEVWDLASGRAGIVRGPSSPGMLAPRPPGTRRSCMLPRVSCLQGVGPNTVVCCRCSVGAQSLASNTGIPHPSEGSQRVGLLSASGSCCDLWGGILAVIFCPEGFLQALGCSTSWVCAYASEPGQTAHHGVARVPKRTPRTPTGLRVHASRWGMWASATIPATPKACHVDCGLARGGYPYRLMLRCAYAPLGSDLGKRLG